MPLAFTNRCPAQHGRALIRRRKAPLGDDLAVSEKLLQNPDSLAPIADHILERLFEEFPSIAPRCTMHKESFSRQRLYK